MNIERILVEDQSGLVREAAQTLFGVCAATGTSGAAVALSGGSTPLALYQYLAAQQAARIQSGIVPEDTAAWDGLWASHLFWGDERAVPPSHPRNNFAAAWRSWLEPISFPLVQVHRMHAEDADLDRAVARYEATLDTYFTAHPEKEGRLDLIFLGMGPDGHTASLFPGSPALDVEDQRVVQAVQPGSEEPRLSLTIPFINQARLVVFLVGGADKAEMVRRVLSPQAGEPHMPAGMIKPTDGRLLWILDHAAASAL